MFFCGLVLRIKIQKRWTSLTDYVDFCSVLHGLHIAEYSLDEASNALDITNRQFLLDALISVSQKDIVVFYVSHNLNEIIKLNGEVYCFIPKFKTIRKIQNEELIDNRFKDLIMFGADSYE